MLLDISVTNFRSIKETQVLSFEAVQDKRLTDTHLIEVDESMQLLRAGAVIGANGSGKSTFIRALEIIQGLLTTGEQEKHPLVRFAGAAFAYEDQLRNQPSVISVRLVLPAEDKVPWVYTYTVRADGERILSETLTMQAGRSLRRLFEREYDSDQKKHVFSWGKRYDGQKGRFGKKLAEDQLFLGPAARAGSPSLQPIYRWFAHQLVIVPAGLSQASERMVISHLQSDRRLINALPKFLRAMDFTDVKEIRLLERQDQLRLVFVHGAGQSRYLSLFIHESLGLRRLVMLALMFLKAAEQDMFLAVDDFSMLLHETVIEQLYRTFVREMRGTGSQMMTTGADTVCLTENLLRYDELWLTDKLSDGSTRCRCLNDFNIKKHDEVRRMYLQGAFSALPVAAVAPLDLPEGETHAKKA